MYDSNSFEQLYASKQPQIVRWSRYKIPGMTKEEVRVEVEIALWKAWKSYKPGPVLFEVYWHRVWMNRKANLIESFFRMKNRLQIPFSPEDVAMLLEVFGIGMEQAVPCPSSDLLTQKIWYLLSQGCTGKEVQRLLRISRRRYDSVLAALRRPSVRAAIVA